MVPPKKKSQIKKRSTAKISQTSTVAADREVRLPLNQVVPPVEVLSLSSTITPSMVAAIKHDYLDASYDARVPTPGESICSPGERWIGVYRVSFEHGLRFPPPSILVDVLGYLGLPICRFLPSSVGVVIAFHVLCTELNIDPTVASFFYFFEIQEAGEYWCFCCRGDRKLLDMLPIAGSNWKSDFLFVSNEGKKLLPGWCDPLDYGLIPPELDQNSSLIVGTLLSLSEWDRCYSRLISDDLVHISRGQAPAIESRSRPSRSRKVVLSSDSDSESSSGNLVHRPRKRVGGVLTGTIALPQITVSPEVPTTSSSPVIEPQTHSPGVSIERTSPSVGEISISAISQELAEVEAAEEEERRLNMELTSRLEALQAARERMVRFDKEKEQEGEFADFKRGEFYPLMQSVYRDGFRAGSAQCKEMISSYLGGQCDLTGVFSDDEGAGPSSSCK